MDAPRCNECSNQAIPSGQDLYHPCMEALAVPVSPAPIAVYRPLIVCRVHCALPGQTDGRNKHESRQGSPLKQAMKEAWSQEALKRGISSARSVYGPYSNQARSQHNAWIPFCVATQMALPWSSFCMRHLHQHACVVFLCIRSLSGFSTSAGQSDFCRSMLQVLLGALGLEAHLSFIVAP